MCENAVGTSVPSQHGVTGTGFILLPEVTKKLHAISETTFFWAIEHWAVKASAFQEEGDGVSHMTAPADHLERGWGLWQERVPRQSSAGSLSWRDGAESLGRLRQREFTWQYLERRTENVQSAPQGVRRVLLSMGLWGHCPRPGKEPPEMTRGSGT